MIEWIGIHHPYMTSYPQHIIDFLPSHLSLDELVAKAKSKRNSNITKTTYFRPIFSKPTKTIAKPTKTIAKPTKTIAKPVTCYSLPSHIYKNIFHNSIPAENSIYFKRISKKC